MGGGKLISQPALGQSNSDGLRRCVLEGRMRSNVARARLVRETEFICALRYRDAKKALVEIV
jgi:hypothetical protein